jgi:hypothetical protein
MKDRIISILKMVEREGIDNLINFLCESDFFTAPSSTRYHLACKGGLAQHTMNVLDAALKLNDQYKTCDNKSVIIAAICHDLCKVNFYKIVNDPPTDPQMRYLNSLLQRHKCKTPPVINKAYAASLIDFLLHKYEAGMELPCLIDNYEVDDQFPLGHGEKSLFVARQYIKLTIDEALAVRWHMGMSDIGPHFDFPSGYAYKNAVEKSKLVTIIQLADMEASFLMEA